MASNSDSIYYVLSKIQTHPELVETIKPLYGNAVMVTISDELKVADAAHCFPDNHLTVNRLAPSFVAKHGELLEQFFQMTDQDNPGYHDVWITTSHVTAAGCYLVDLSFE